MGKLLANDSHLRYAHLLMANGHTIHFVDMCATKRSFVSSMKREYEVIIEKDEDGYYHARVPELPGCFTQAESLREVNKNIKEAIDLYLEIINN